MGHRLPGSRENYFDRHDLTEIIEKMHNCDFNRPNSEEVMEEKFMRNSKGVAGRELYQRIRDDVIQKRRKSGAVFLSVKVISS